MKYLIALLFLASCEFMENQKSEIEPALINTLQAQYTKDKACRISPHPEEYDCQRWSCSQSKDCLKQYYNPELKMDCKDRPKLKIPLQYQPYME